MKIDACHAADAINYKFAASEANRSVPIHLYNRGTDLLRLHWKASGGRHPLLRKNCSQLWSCHVPNNGSIVAIVDDDEAVRNAIGLLMRSMGIGARAFSSGEEFLRSPELSRTGCLVVDFNMPRMSGFDLHNNLSLLGRDIPTVLITAYPNDDMRARALHAGFICYLRKPFNESDLLNCIQTALDRARTR